MNESELKRVDDEISLFDLWEILQEGWRIVAGAAALGTVAAGVALVVTPPKYEAVSTIRIGVVAGVEIEAATTTLERFKSAMFVLEAAKKSGSEKLAERISIGDGLTGEYVKAQLIKETSLVELKTAGDTPDSSKKLNDMLAQQLAERHEVLGAPLKEKLKAEIALVREKLNTAERELVDLSSIASVKTPTNVQFSAASLLVSQRIQKQSEVFGLRQQLTNLELMMVSPATQSTQALEMPFVPVKPVSPKTYLLIAQGVIGGLLLGMLAVFLKEGWLRAKRARVRAKLA
jgi:uncharacterized protein involved in exopolysaccharide biosynthesis